MIFTRPRCVVLLSLALVSGCAGLAPQPPVLRPLPHGIAMGLTAQNQAVIWARAERPGTLRLDLRPLHGPAADADRARSAQVAVSADSDLTGKWVIGGLHPESQYRYQISGPGMAGPAGATGYFQTPPSPHDPRAVTMAWGADLAGQNICRHRDEGFPILASIAALKPDLFIGAGDMIYADGRCRATNRYGDPQIPGPSVKAADLAGYRAQWRYVREDPGLQKLLASVVYMPVWDDHEVVNNVGPLHDVREYPPYQADRHLMPLGMRAFLEYNPVAPARNTPNRLYRRLRWGQHVELFFLDTRQYRDHNDAADSYKYPKTMLGREQLIWLKSGLGSSTATWKVVVSSVPLSITTAYRQGRQPDAWSDGDFSGGYEQELLDILQSAHRARVRNMIWLTGDVHMGAVIRYRPIADDPAFVVHEAISGPLHAKVFGNRDMDPTLRPERLFVYAPEDSRTIDSYQQARRWWNFGVVQVSQTGNALLSLRDVEGKSVYTLQLDPENH